jgi:cell division protein FtsQ
MKAKIYRSLKITCLVTALIVAGTVAYAGIRYLRTAPRFEVRQLSVSGLKRIDENQIVSRANLEIGTNVFVVDLDEMRERIERLQWVRHALVHRVLPDQVVIKVIERQPIGLARINTEIFQFDIDAMILGLDSDTSSMGTSFPILDGLRPTDTEGNLKKVAIYSKVVADLGQTELSEIHINDAGEVSIVSVSDPLIVNLGTEEFHARWTKYLQLRQQIRKQYPDAVRVDLRFRNQVIVRMKQDETDEVIWDGERKIL